MPLIRNDRGLHPQRSTLHNPKRDNTKFRVFPGSRKRPLKRASGLNSDPLPAYFPFCGSNKLVLSDSLANEEMREKEGNASHKVLAKVFKMRKWRKKKETRMHFFQTADAVETALGKDISQSGATFYLIYSNTSTKYLTLCLNILRYSKMFLSCLWGKKN